MQLALTILAGFGALLFLFCFLAYVLSGFRHHFVTGLIATLPVLNIVTLPSLWDQNSRKFFIGLIGLIIAVSAWFFGADKGYQGLFSNNTSNSEVVVTSTPTSSTSSDTEAKTKISKKDSNKSFDESDLIKLPSKALYKMEFEPVPIQQISTLKGRIVQITTNDNEQVEGRIKSIAPGSIMLEGLFENELPISSIKQLKLMVKKAN